MAYAIEGDETVVEAVRRITGEQVAEAVSGLEQATGDGLAAVVHDARKRAKKLRGLIRLVRPVLGPAYGRANGSFRDAGRELSGLRDAQAALVTFDALVAASAGGLPEGGVGAVRAGLARLAEQAGEAGRAGDDPRTGRAADLLRAGGGHVARAAFDADGWAAVGSGLEATYRAGRRALAGVRRDTADPGLMHEWRKRAKDAWYHVRLLQGAAPSVLDPIEDRFHLVADALGDAHDLAVICARLQASPGRFGDPAEVAAVCELADGRRADLVRRAVGVGSRLYAEKPGAYARRVGAYWRLWHGTGDEEPVGGLADLFPAPDDLDALDLEALRDRAGDRALPAHLFPTRSQLLGELRAAGPR